MYVFDVYYESRKKQGGHEMVKLVKKDSTVWNGNGFGSDTATWVVKGHEHIEVLKLAGSWTAIDRNTNSRLISGQSTKADALEILSTKI
jgi:hypothetical protein